MADILYRFNNLYKSGDASNVKMFPFFDADSLSLSFIQDETFLSFHI